MAAAPRSESEAQLLCWRCKEPNPPAFFCPRCEAVQSLPSDSNFSSILGFGGGPDIEESVLQKRYYELSRGLHPDRFQTGSPEEQRASLQATALLNAAFKTLKDVESRGRWWLERSGESLGRNNNQVPPALAAQVFEIQEKIAERIASSGDAQQRLTEELQGIQDHLTERMNEGKDEIVNILRGWPTEKEAASSARANLKSLLSELSYLRTLTRDVRTALEA